MCIADADADADVAAAARNESNCLRYLSLEKSLFF